MEQRSPAAHTIRLRGPWQLEHGDRDAQSAPSAIIRLPAGWSVMHRLGPGWVRLSRRFHCPSGLGPNTRVDLVATAWPCPLQVSLGDRLLGQLAPGSSEGRWEITSLLATQNRLQVELQLPPDSVVGDRPADDPPVGHFWLEITSAA